MGIPRGRGRCHQAHYSMIIAYGLLAWSLLLTVEVLFGLFWSFLLAVENRFDLFTYCSPRLEIECGLFYLRFSTASKKDEQQAKDLKCK